MNHRKFLSLFPNPNLAPFDKECTANLGHFKKDASVYPAHIFILLFCQGFQSRYIVLISPILSVEQPYEVGQAERK